MDTFKLSKRSRQRLKDVHPDLVAVVELALSRSPMDFTVLEGMRTVERQRELFARGASKTMNSRHLTGHAVDIAPLVGGEVSWHWPHYHTLAPIVKQAAEDLGVQITWGGDWTSFKDGPHWQLSWDEYGKADMGVRHRTPPQRPTAPKPDPAPTKPTPARTGGLMAALAALIAKIFGGKA